MQHSPSKRSLGWRPSSGNPVSGFPNRKTVNAASGVVKTTGHEYSAVAGFTYNLENTSTNYQNGVDFHLDWAASQFLSKQFLVGVVGYLYQEVGCDSGSGDHVGCFQSRVVGLGPQVGYLFPVGDLQGYLNLKAYGEFANQDRPDGWNIWPTFSIAPATPTPPTAQPLVTKY